jgi:hypothetical protein
MLENKPPIVQEERNTDLSELDMQKIEKFKADGLPGLANVGDASIVKCMELYLSGKTYGQIANMTRLKKPLVMYLSHKFNWFLLKKEYFQDLSENIQQRTLEAKIVSQDFLLQLIQFWQSKIGKRINKFLLTGDEDVAKEIDLKEIDKYLKTIEILHKLTGERTSSEKPPAVGLNLGDGVTVKKVGDNAVEITPKQKATGSLLSQLANFRREQENSKKNDEKSDIVIDKSQRQENE